MGFGSFQAGVGRLSADFNLIGAWIIGIILIIAAIVLLIIGLIPMKSINCDEKIDPEDCKKKMHLEFLWGLFMIPIAILIIGIAYWWRKTVKKNKTAAQIGGTVAEIEFFKNLFN